MSVRGVWVVRPPCQAASGSKQGSEIVFSRRYATVERLHRRTAEPKGVYFPLPLDKEIVVQLLLHCLPPSQQFVEERDGMDRVRQWPVFELFHGKLWPVVCLVQNGLLFAAAVPFQPTEDCRRPHLVRIPGITAAVSLLKGMSEVLSSESSDHAKLSSQESELQQYLCLAAPFGSPTETSLANLKFQMQFRKATAMPKDKQPAWRPAVYKGPSKLHLHIREEIRAVQYDRPDVSNVCQVHGTVACKAELEGQPDVLLALTTPPGPAHIDHLTVPPRVQSADSQPLLNTSPDSSLAQNRKIRFSAPLETFVLCQYQATVPFLPIRGFYQMKGDKLIELLVQLKMNESIKNNFEFFEVHLPFFNRGPIEKVENVSPTWSTVNISSDKHKLVWVVGQKLPAKTLEVSLRATVSFVEFYEEDAAQEGPEDSLLENATSQGLEKKFCVGQNAFCELHFKLLDYTLSGCAIDPRSITMFPSVKYRLLLVREFISAQYRIWNSHGDVVSMPSMVTTS